MADRLSFIEGRAAVRGSLRELVGKRWMLRSWELAGNKLVNGRRSFDLDKDCEVSEHVEAVDNAKRKLYMFEIALPASAADDDAAEGEEEDVEEDDPDSDENESNTLAKRKHFFQHYQMMPSECSRTRKTTGRSLLTMGAAGVACGIGAVVVGATTLGLGLVPFAAFSVVTIGSGSALTRKSLGVEKRYLMLASRSRRSANRWRDEISRAIRESSAVKTSKPPREWSWGEGRAEASRRRGIFLQKKRIGSGTLVRAKIKVRAKPLTAFLALLGEDDNLLASEGGVVGAIERIQRIDESSDIAKISLRTLVPSRGHYTRKSTAALAAAVGFGRSLFAALASAVIALFRARHPARKRLLKEARISLFTAVWLAWASLSMTHFPARDFRVRREWQVTDDGVYVVDITSSENEEEADELLSAQFSVTPGDEADENASPSFSTVVVWLRLQLPGRLARSRHTSTIFGRVWDGVASLYAEELALSIVDLKNALSNQPLKRTKSIEEQIQACKARIAAASAAVAAESEGIARRKRTRQLQRELTEQSRLVRLAHDGGGGEDLRQLGSRETSRVVGEERKSDEEMVGDGKKKMTMDEQDELGHSNLFRLIPRNPCTSTQCRAIPSAAVDEDCSVSEWIVAIAVIWLIFSLATRLFG